MDTPEIVPLRLREVVFSGRYEKRTFKRFFKEPLEYIDFDLVATVGEREIVFSSLWSDPVKDALEVLFESPQCFLIGDSPAFCGTNFTGTIAELVEANNVAEDSLIIFEDNKILATVYGDEIPALQSWVPKPPPADRSNYGDLLFFSTFSSVLFVLLVIRPLISGSLVPDVRGAVALVSFIVFGAYTFFGMPRVRCRWQIGVLFLVLFGGGAVFTWIVHDKVLTSAWEGYGFFGLFVGFTMLVLKSALKERRERPSRSGSF